MSILRSFRVSLSSLVLSAALFVAPSLVNAAQCDCGQPQSSGTGPAASDCLNILKTAVGGANCNAATCSDARICDTDGNGDTTASDALVCLKKAVGQSVTLTCCKAPDVDGIIGCRAGYRVRRSSMVKLGRAAASSALAAPGGRTAAGACLRSTSCSWFCSWD